MAARRADVAPAGPRSLPDAGLDQGWEPAVLLTLTLLLLSLGLVTLYSASSFLARGRGLPDYYYVARQAAGAAIGLGVLVACARIPYRWWAWAAWPMMGLTLVLLAIPVLPGTEAVAPEVNGARRWIHLGVSLQPSELAKVSVVLWTAMLAVKKREHFRSLSRGLLPFIVVWGALVGLIAAEPDLSTACLVALLGLMVVFAAGGRIAHFAFLGLLSAPVLALQMQVGFRARRLLAFLDPASDGSGAGFQVVQSLIAIGSGRLTGVGFGEGRQKFGFVPEPHNDFIFSMVGEEWGLLGVAAILALFLGIAAVGFRIARSAPDLFGQLIAIGLTNLIALQAMLHMAVGLGLVPTTGLTLPLVSYGRSNLLVTLAALGILMAVAREAGDGRTPRRARA